MQAYATLNDNGWTLFYTYKGIVKEFKRQQFQSENAALLFAAMNARLLK